jgi:transcriptional regulator with XRE-family HTH domain
MARLTLEELQAKYPQVNRDEYDRARAEAELACHMAELVYAMREHAGLTQAELAGRMKTTQSSVARMEGGGSLPSIGMITRVARATGVSVRISAPGVIEVDLSPAPDAEEGLKRA